MYSCHSSFLYFYLTVCIFFRMIMKTSDSTKQLFKNPALERFSRSNAPAVITALFLLAVFIFSLGLYLSSLVFLIQFYWCLLGLLIFSLAEYLIHRYVFHFGDYRNVKSWQSKIHGVHHDFPSDKERLALPIPLALGISLLLFFLLQFMLGDIAYGLFSGFISGYGAYFLIHYLIHTRKPPKNNLRVLWRNHHIHHHVDEHKAFGVTSPFWDWIFRTRP